MPPEAERRIAELEKRIADLERVENFPFIESLKNKIVDGTVIGGETSSSATYTQTVAMVDYPTAYDEMIDLEVDGTTYRFGVYN